MINCAPTRSPSGAVTASPSWFGRRRHARGIRRGRGAVRDGTRRGGFVLDRRPWLSLDEELDRYAAHQEARKSEARDS